MPKETQKVILEDEDMNMNQEAENIDHDTDLKHDQTQDCAETDSNKESGDNTQESEDNTQESEDNTQESGDNTEESERYLRLMAEFQNFKRRVEKEKKDIRTYGNENIMSELLPVLDNFDRAMDTEHDDISGYVKGMELIYQQLSKALEHAGLREIEALGEDFDPTKHNAVMTEESDEHEVGKVSKVLRKGYTLNDKVIRPSMVSVVK